MVEQVNLYKSDGTNNLKQRNHLGDHVACMVEQGNPYKSDGTKNLNQRNHLEDLGINGTIMLS
jgi:hypothetical protein